MCILRAKHKCIKIQITVSILEKKISFEDHFTWSFKLKMLFYLTFEFMNSTMERITKNISLFRHSAVNITLFNLEPFVVHQQKF